MMQLAALIVAVVTSASEVRSTPEEFDAPAKRIVVVTTVNHGQIRGEILEKEADRLLLAVATANTQLQYVIPRSQVIGIQQTHSHQQHIDKATIAEFVHEIIFGGPTGGVD